MTFANHPHSILTDLIRVKLKVIVFYRVSRNFATYHPYNQAISVFGIYTHAKMGRRDFWDTLSRQLENKGQEYVARCAFMEKPLCTGDNVILPASFPQLPVQEIQESLPLVKVGEEDLKNVRERDRCKILVAVAHTDTTNI